jgi:F420-dependent oxidoreductase-like protein
MRLRVLMEPRHGSTYDRILALAKATEDAGFDAFFRNDHFMGVDPTDITYEPTDSWTTLAGLARETKRVRLGTLLTAGTYRVPGQLAVIVANVDQMSGGRVELGLGAGWYEREHNAFGIPFPSLKERFDRLEESLAIIRGLWVTPPGERFSFTGNLFTVDDCANTPRPTQEPHPTIIVGGMGPRRTPALAARYAGEFNGAFGPGLKGRFEVFHRACEKIGRDPSTARQSVVIPVACGATQADVDHRLAQFMSPRLAAAAAAGGPQVVIDRLGELEAEGADTVYLHIYDIDDLDHIRLLGEEVVAKVSA